MNAAPAKPKPQAAKPAARPALLNGGMTSSEAAYLLLDRDLRSFLDQEAKVLATEDPEAVHQMRVAARRMREAIGIFAPFLPQSMRLLGPEIRWIFQTLGTVRDLDVEMQKLEEWRTEDSEGGRALLGINKVLAAERAAAKAQAVAAIRSDRYLKLRAKLAELVAKGPSSNRDLGRTPILAVAPDLVGDSYTKVLRSAKKLGKPPSADEVHRLRKNAKRFRYALEFFADLYGKEADRVISRLKTFQDLLGSRQDLMLATDQLGKLCEGEALSDAERSLTKQIVRQYRKEAENLLDESLKAVSDLTDKPWRRLAASMEVARKTLWTEPGKDVTPA